MQPATSSALEHPMVCAHSSPMPNTKETLLCLDTTSLLVVSTSGDAYYKKNVFCCREEILLVCMAAAENPPASTWGTVPKLSAHGLGWWAHRAAHLNLLKSINQWLIISSTLKETFHNRRKQLSVYETPQWQWEKQWRYGNNLHATQDNVPSIKF